MSGILVTGISGFIGGHVWALLSEREDVWGLYGATGSIPLKPERQMQVDLSKTHHLAELVLDLEPETIIHLAGMSRPDTCRRHSLLAWKVNNAATREMAVAADKIGARVIFASSDHVFEGTKGTYKESDTLGPICVYGETKKAAERSILTILDDSVVLRINNTFGPPRFRGGSFSEWILDRESRGETVPLYVDQFRSPIDVLTVAEVLVELTYNPYKGVLHLGGCNRMNRATFGRMLLQHLGRDTNSILELHAAKADPKGHMPVDTSYDISKAHQVLETPIPNIEESLRLVYGPGRKKY